MSDPHFKRVLVVIVIVLAILAGSLYLFARPTGLCSSGASRRTHRHA
jgi:hypothetical protein